jgi:hypothetical protein
MDLAALRDRISGLDAFVLAEIPVTSEDRTDAVLTHESDKMRVRHIISA